MVKSLKQRLSQMAEWLSRASDGQGHSIQQQPMMADTASKELTRLVRISENRA
jgi:hypothetical protein